MDRLQHYILLISNRGDARGNNGGLLDLLEWCGKGGLAQVTAEEAKRFWEAPDSLYENEDEL